MATAEVLAEPGEVAMLAYRKSPHGGCDMMRSRRGVGVELPRHPECEKNQIHVTSPRNSELTVMDLINVVATKLGKMRNLIEFEPASTLMVDARKGKQSMMLSTSKNCFFMCDTRILSSDLDPLFLSESKEGLYLIEHDMRGGIIGITHVADSGQLASKS